MDDLPQEPPERRVRSRIAGIDLPSPDQTARWRRTKRAQQAAQQAARETAARQAAEAAARETTARQAAARQAAARQAARETAARQAAEAAARETAARQAAARQAAARQAAQETAAREAREAAAREAAARQAAAREAAAREAAARQAAQETARETATREAREAAARQAAQETARETAAREAAAREAAAREAAARLRRTQQALATAEAARVAEMVRQAAARQAEARRLQQERLQQERLRKERLQQERAALMDRVYRLNTRAVRLREQAAQEQLARERMLAVQTRQRLARLDNLDMGSVGQSVLDSSISRGITEAKQAEHTQAEHSIQAQHIQAQDMHAEHTHAEHTWATHAWKAARGVPGHSVWRPPPLIILVQTTAGAGAQSASRSRRRPRLRVATQPVQQTTGAGAQSASRSRRRPPRDVAAQPVRAEQCFTLSELGAQTTKVLGDGDCFFSAFLKLCPTDLLPTTLLPAYYYPEDTTPTDLRKMAVDTILDSSSRVEHNSDLLAEAVFLNRNFDRRAPRNGEITRATPWRQEAEARLRLSKHAAPTSGQITAEVDRMLKPMIEWYAQRVAGMHSAFPAESREVLRAVLMRQSYYADDALTSALHRATGVAVLALEPCTGRTRGLKRATFIPPTGLVVIMRLQNVHYTPLSFGAGRIFNVADGGAQGVPDGPLRILIESAVFQDVPAPAPH